MEEIYRHFNERYANGYYSYFVLITFKDGTPMADLHPSKGVKVFEKMWEGYIKKYKVKYVLYPELSHAGRLHYHGVMCFKASCLVSNDKQYDFHERELRLLKNWIRRRCGIHNFQRIGSFCTNYQVYDTRRFGVPLVTSFNKSYQYIIKDFGMYSFMQPIYNMNISVLPSRRRRSVIDDATGDHSPRAEEPPLKNHFTEK